MNNSIEQDPCLVTAYLLGHSRFYHGTFATWFPPYYGAPTGANRCECNTVTYSMISACSVCQNGSYMSWSSWSSGCTMMSIGEYPLDIPAGTKVPNWAFMDVTGGGFNSAAAQSNGDLPESTATSVPSATTTVIYSTTGPSGPASPDVGAIAGGVIGGIAGAAVIIGLVTWYFVKHCRSSKALSAGFSNQPHPYDSSDQTNFPSDQTTLSVHPHPTSPVTSSNSMVLNPSLPPLSFSSTLEFHRSRIWAYLPLCHLFSRK
ncbi:hypothetical protein BDR04DRAFT_4714 [Suillus decipiens]|nr:hypothetical protein BDR04DRAFT_4714 [Suillus decipiens]